MPADAIAAEQERINSGLYKRFRDPSSAVTFTVFYLRLQPPSSASSVPTAIGRGLRTTDNGQNAHRGRSLLLLVSPSLSPSPRRSSDPVYWVVTIKKSRDPPVCLNLDTPCAIAPSLRLAPPRPRLLSTVYRLLALLYRVTDLDLLASSHRPNLSTLYLPCSTARLAWWGHQFRLDQGRLRIIRRGVLPPAPSH